MATTESTTAPAAPAFGGEVAMELTNLTAVNLVSGAQKSLPPYLAGQAASSDKDMGIVGWMEGADMDFAFVGGCGYTRLSGCALLDRNVWDDATPDSVSAALQPTGKDMGRKFDGAGANNPTNVTIGFQIRSGPLGLLQFMEISSDNPPTAKIRYKLMKPGANGGVALAPVSALSPESLNERLEAAMSIFDDAQKNKPLAAVATDAAKVGQIEILKKALAAMSNDDSRDEATHAATVLLNQHGLRKVAIEMAKGIRNILVRDQTMSELAQ
jgi:hypothetical protein